MIKRFQKDYYPTLSDLLESEYYSKYCNDYPEIFSKGHFQLYQEDAPSFESAIYEMNETMVKVCMDIIFGGYIFSEDPTTNRELLVRFITQYRFYRIGKPNAPMFRHNIIKVHMTTRKTLEYAFMQYQDLLTDGNTSKAHSEGRGDARSASTRMAQDNVNLDIEKTTLQTPEINALGINKNVSDSTGENNKANIDNLMKYEQMVDRLFNRYEKAFLGTIGGL